ncbi:MAG: hypothetical protein QXH05_03595 [Thermosphaera sp.]
MLSASSVQLLLEMLGEVGSSIVGLVENVSENPVDLVMSLCRAFGAKYLSSVPLDSSTGTWRRTHFNNKEDESL